MAALFPNSGEMMREESSVLSSMNDGSLVLQQINDDEIDKSCRPKSQRAKAKFTGVSRLPVPGHPGSRSNA